MDPRQFLDRFLAAETEAEAIEVLDAAGYWNDPSVWRLYGDDESNYSTVGNQQSYAINAVGELVTNSTDALLQQECWLSGVNPEDKTAAPSTMKDAFARFIKPPTPLTATAPVAAPVTRKRRRKTTRGSRPPLNQISPPAKSLTDWPKEERRRYAEDHLTIAATQDDQRSTNLSLTIVDAGEGQTPDDIPTTFCSLSKSNKVKVDFLQGKFNMGSTGVLSFCGTQGFKLILTRRNPALLPSGHTARDTEWGFTITRLERPTADRRTSRVTYLAPVPVPGDKNTTLSFAADTLPLLPQGGRGKDVAEPYVRALSHGTLVKLYDYRFEGQSGLATTSAGRSDKGMCKALEAALPEMLLPAVVYECRSKFVGRHTNHYSTAIGALNHLKSGGRVAGSANTDIEAGPFTSDITLEGHTARMLTYVLKDDKAAKYRPPSGTKAVFFMVNGQTHAVRNRRFFAARSVGLKDLEDNLLVYVDCSNLTRSQIEDLFMANREQLRGTAIREMLIGEIRTALADRAELQDLATDARQRRRKSSTERASLNTQWDHRQGLLWDLLPEGPSPHLGSNGNGANGHGHTTPVPQVPYVGKSVPTYWRWAATQSSVLSRKAQLGTQVSLSYETDAANDYFSRQQNPGKISFAITDSSGRSVPVRRADHLSNGRGRVVFVVSATASPNTTFKATVTISGSHGLTLTQLSATVTAVSKQKTKSRPKKQTPLPQGPHVAIQLVSSPDWTAHRFTEQSVASVTEDPSSGTVVYVNIDNHALCRALQHHATLDASKLQNQYATSVAAHAVSLLVANGTNGDSDDTEPDCVAVLEKQAPAFAAAAVEALA